MQTAQLPEVGKTYVSQVDPTIQILVTQFEEADFIAGFFVYGIDPINHETDEMDFIKDEWNDLKFTLQP